MTLPQNVKDGVAQLDNAMMFHAGDLSYASWTAIRAHLMSQEESITNLRSAAQKTVLANADLRTRAELAESRLAAANALLRNIAGCQWFNREAPATVELIDAHLQGAGDET